MGDPKQFGILEYASIGASVLEAGANVGQAVAGKREAMAAAHAERVGLQDRATDRLAEQRRLRGAQRVAAAAGNLALDSTSVAAIEKARDQAFAEEGARDRTNTAALLAAIRARGRSSLALGGLGAVSSLVKAPERLSAIGQLKKKKKVK